MSRLCEFSSHRSLATEHGHHRSMWAMQFRDLSHWDQGENSDLWDSFILVLKQMHAWVVIFQGIIDMHLKKPEMSLGRQQRWGS